MKNKNLIAYALQYASYILYNLKEGEALLIKEVILFGSVARGEATADSDIDIFFDAYKEQPKLTERIEYLTKQFYTSEIGRFWKNLNIDREIKPVTGVLGQWKLKPSLIANGFTLLGKYRASLTSGRPFVILYWKKIDSQSIRVSLSKKLYGYSYKTKRYKGIIEEFGTKLSSNCLLVPVEESKQIFTLFEKLKIHYKTIYVGKM